MKVVARAARAVWGFIAGDDPWTGAGVACAIGLTALVGHWWILPPAVLVVLALSLWRAAR